MISIKSVMTDDHKKCDEIFSNAELQASKNEWENAQLSIKIFSERLLYHFEHEEKVLFPEFENATGMKHGPTSMMLHEHEQMRELLNEMEQAVNAHNQDRYLGLSETMLICMKQHKIKEEKILYPMIDQECAKKVEELTRSSLNLKNNETHE